MPKSATFICPLLFIKRFEVFRSRCRIQLLCRYSTADVSCKRRVLSSDGRNGSAMSSWRVLRSCSRKSMTKNTLVLKISCRFGIDGLPVDLLVHCVAHHHFSEVHDVGMPGLHQRLYLPQARDGESVRRVVHLELLQGDHFSCSYLPCSRDPSV